MTLPLAGQVALVTGASSGIGQAAAIALAEAGADVALNYLTLPEGAESAQQQIERLGRQARRYPVDISDQVAVERMVEEIVLHFGHVDILVSAAVFSEREPFLTADMEGFRKTLDVSMWGAFYVLRAVCRQMVAQKRGGRVVIVSSPHAVIAFPNCMAYNMAKAALDQMMRTAAVELLPHGIRVNGIYPGWTDTPGERKYYSEETLRKAAQNLPLKRLARPEEIAKGILFLVSPDSDYMTGSILSMDGGIFLPWWSKRNSGEGV